MKHDIDSIKKVSMKLPTSLGYEIPIEVEIPNADLTLAEMVPPVQSLTDSIVAIAISDLAASGRAVSCAPGCDACCRQLIPLSVPEVFFMMDMIRNFPKARQMRTIDRFNEVYDAVTDNGLMDRMAALLTDRRSTSDLSVGRAFFELGCRCPFLEDGQCGIYDFRPIVCREYCVTSSATLCRDPFNQKIETLSLQDSRIDAAARLAAIVLGKPRTMVPLPLIFDWYRDNHPLSQIRRPAEMLFETLFLKIIGKKSTLHRRG